MVMRAIATAMSVMCCHDVMARMQQVLVQMLSILTEKLYNLMLASFATLN